MSGGKLGKSRFHEQTTGRFTLKGVIGVEGGYKCRSKSESKSERGNAVSGLSCTTRVPCSG